MLHTRERLMKNFKRTVSILLSILMVASLFGSVATTVSAADDKTVYFVNTKEWTTVYSYLWHSDGTGENAPWPGQPAILSDAVSGYAIYSFDAEEYDGIIFNDAGISQTNNLSVSAVAGKYYEPYTATAYSTPEEAVEAFNSSVRYDYYVCGEGGLCNSHWQLSDVQCGMTKNADGSYSKVFEYIPAGTYEFKVNNGTWSEAYPNENYSITVARDDATVEIILTIAKGILVDISYPSETTAPTTHIPVNGGNAPKFTTYYLPVCDDSCTTFFQALEDIGVETTYSYRSAVAAINGMKDYLGTDEQNDYLLSLMKEGILLNPDYSETTIDPVEPETNVVYFINNVGWENVYVYVWGGAHTAATYFPGEQATLIDEENNLYGYNIGDSTNIVFNDGGSEQTATLYASEAVDKYYNMANGLFYSNLGEALTGRNSSGLIPAGPPEYYFVAAGSVLLFGTAWDPTNLDNLLEYNESSGKYEITYRNVAVGTYQFLITTNGQFGYYDFNLEGEAAGVDNYSVIEVTEDNSTVVISCDAVKAYVTVNGVDVETGSKDTDISYLCYTVINDNTARITGLVGSVEDLVIPSYIDGYMVTSIGIDAFHSFKSIKTVTIPSTVTDIGMNAFDDCSNIDGVYISDISSWCDITFGSVKSNPLYYAENLYLNGVLVKELVVPETVTSINPYAFYGCYSLTNVIIPESVKYIGQGAFWKCIYVKSITVRNSACEISDDSTTFPIGTTIYSYRGSSANVYASNYGRSFTVINGESCHIWGRKTGEDSTCTESGWYQGWCLICGEEVYETLDATGHSYTSKVTKSATYFATGKKLFTCQNCGATKTKTIAMKTLKTPKLKVTGGKNKLTVKYNKVTGATGFQLKCKSGGMTIMETYNTKKTVSKVLKNLSKGTYKVQIRAFVKSGGKKKYSEWSAVKKAKVK